MAAPFVAGKAVGTRGDGGEEVVLGTLKVALVDGEAGAKVAKGDRLGFGEEREGGELGLGGRVDRAHNVRAETDGAETKVAAEEDVGDRDRGPLFRDGERGAVGDGGGEGAGEEARGVLKARRVDVHGQVVQVCAEPLEHGRLGAALPTQRLEEGSVRVRRA